MPLPTLREDDAHIGGRLVKNKDLANVADRLRVTWTNEDGGRWNEAVKDLAKLLGLGSAMTHREPLDWEDPPRIINCSECGHPHFNMSHPDEHGLGSYDACPHEGCPCPFATGDNAGRARVALAKERED